MTLAIAQTTRTLKLWLNGLLSVSNIYELTCHYWLWWRVKQANKSFRWLWRELSWVKLKGNCKCQDRPTVYLFLLWIDMKTFCFLPQVKHQGLVQKEINKSLEPNFATILTKLNLSIDNIFDNTMAETTTVDLVSSFTASL